MTDQPAPRPMMKFRRSSTPPPDAGVVRRQMDVTALAFRHLGDVAVVREFLNSAHPELGARPIDVAGESADGLKRVTSLMVDARDPNTPA